MGLFSCFTLCVFIYNVPSGISVVLLSAFISWEGLNALSVGLVADNTALVVATTISDATLNRSITF